MTEDFAQLQTLSMDQLWQKARQAYTSNNISREFLIDKVLALSEAASGNVQGCIEHVRPNEGITVPQNVVEQFKTRTREHATSSQRQSR